MMKMNETTRGELATAFKTSFPNYKDLQPHEREIKRAFARCILDKEEFATYVRGSGEVDKVGCTPKATLQARVNYYWRPVITQAYERVHHDDVYNEAYQLLIKEKSKMSVIQLRKHFQQQKEWRLPKVRTYPYALHLCCCL
jgi:hypothetical protein